MVTDGWKEWEHKFPVSAARRSESELFGCKKVWEVAQILFLAGRNTQQTIVNATIRITFFFLLDTKITNLGFK